jgi:hypothetical protein
LNIITSQSFTIYSFHSNLTSHFSLALDQDHEASKSLQLTISALINHFSKSVCIAHAACGAVLHIGIAQALDSFSQVVK